MARPNSARSAGVARFHARPKRVRFVGASVPLPFSRLSALRISGTETPKTFEANTVVGLTWARPEIQAAASRARWCGCQWPLAIVWAEINLGDEIPRAGEVLTGKPVAG